MTIGLLLLLTLLGQDSPGRGGAVFEQMRAANAALRTVTFEFRQVDNESAKVSLTGKPERTTTIGKFWFQEPDRVRIEFNQGSGSVTLTADRANSRRLVVDSESGGMRGLIDEGGTAGHYVAGLGLLHPRTMDEFLSALGAFQRLDANKHGKLIQITGQLRQHSYEYDVDPERGFSLVRMRDIDRRSHVTIRQEAFYELHEPVRGLWVPQQVKLDQYLGDDLSHHITIETVPGTCQVNVELPSSLFKLEFPVGTEVNDGLRRKVYIVGGGTSQSRRKATEMIEEAKRLNIPIPTPPGHVLPQPGALSSTPRESTGKYWVSVVLLLIIGGVAVVLYRRRRSQST